MLQLTQSEFIRNYNDSHREQFNPAFFQRENADIMDCVKKVILSIEKDKYFTLKVVDMEEIYDYETIYNTLREYQESRRKKNKGENFYDYIDIKDSDIMLLKIKYFIRHNGTEKQEVENPNPEATGKITIDVKDPYTVLTVLIALPRFVNKYYFRLNGNFYTSTFQIVDGSTYNNTSTNNGPNKKADCITFKTLFMPVRIYKRYKDMVDIISKQTIRNIIYGSNIFNNFIDCMYYILANYGLYGTFNFLDIHCIYLHTQPTYDQDYYCFEKHGIYISVPKYCSQQDPMIQSLVSTIYDAINKDTNIDDLFNIRYWIRNLGLAYKGSTNPIDKGLFVLDSIDSIYDIKTYEEVHLPEEDKKDIYDILRWLMREFNYLKMKDNVDVSKKRVRIAEYIAAIYANKISKGIHRISDYGKRVTLTGVIKAVRTDPMYVVNNIINMSNLVSYVDLVNDNDATLALKYTYKGISGLGEDGTSIQMNYRYVDPSHAGILDLDASSNSDPGMSGMICPMTPLYNGSSFTQYEEPNYWRTQYKQYQDEWKKKKNPKAINPIFYTDEDVKNDSEDYKALRQKVIDESLQIDRIKCPIFDLLDPTVDYSNSGKLIRESKESKNSSPYSQSLFDLLTIQEDFSEDDNNKEDLDYYEYEDE